jgi:AcrR family transcriptional regulator
VSAFLVKPLDFRHLVPTIETAVARHRELVAATAGIAPRRRTPRPVEDRRKEITAAAVRVFYERGYEAATIQDVADRVGMLKGSLYHHISSKDDLLYDIVRNVAVRAAETVARSADGVDAAARLHASLLAYAGFVTQSIEAVTVAVRDTRSLPDHRRDAVDAIRSHHLEALTTLVADAQSAGQVTGSLSPAVLAETLVGMSDWVAERHAADGPAAADLTAAFVFLVTRGLAKA